MTSLRLKTGFLVLIAMLSAFSATLAHADPITVTDILGRKVTLERPATHIVLGQGRHMQGLALLLPDPVSVVAGWKEDMKRDPATYAAFRAKFPAIDAIPSLGNASSPSFSVEKAISLAPDLVVLSRYVGEVDDQAAMDQITAKLDAAGIPVVFVDFFADPLRDTVPSLKVLGAVLGRQAQAERLITFYQAHLKTITDRTSTLTSRPDLFMQVHAAPGSCCYTPGKGVFTDFIDAAGGHNIAADVLPGATGEVSLEFLVSKDPTWYIATGGAHMTSRGGLVLGTGTTRDTASKTFETLLAGRGIADLTAVRTGHTFGIWHLFNDTPLHIVMVEMLAKKLHPDLFPDVDPGKTMAALNAMSAVPLSGTFWIDKNGD